MPHSFSNNTTKSPKIKKNVLNKFHSQTFRSSRLHVNEIHKSLTRHVLYDGGEIRIDTSFPGF